MLAGGIGYVTRDRAARLAQAGQRVAEALAGARTAIEAGDLTLAGQRVAEAQGLLGSERERLPQAAADTDRIRREIEARQADVARFSQFLKGATDAQHGMSMHEDLDAERLAKETLAIYSALTEKDWLSRLEGSYLTADQKQQVRETAYVTLVSLADYGVRWLGSREDPKSVARSLDLLQRVQAFHQPTRAFYFVRAECRRQQGDTAAAAEDEKQFRAATARTAWDYFLPGHTAAWRGDPDESIRSYQAALRLQADHYNSVFFLAKRLSEGKIKRLPEAIAYATCYIAIRPGWSDGYHLRGRCLMELGQMDEAKADFESSLALCKTDIDRCGPLGDLATLYRDQGKLAEAVPLVVQALEVRRRVQGEEHPETLNCMNNLGILYTHQGKLAQAEPLLVKALEVRRRVLGEEHPDTAGSMDRLAGLYITQGKLAQAEPLLVKALEVGRRNLGEQHPSRLPS